MNQYSEMYSIAKQFDIDERIIDIHEHGSGNINRTMFISTASGDEYIMQRINVNVFTKPYVLMRNIASVTDYCKRFIEQNGGNPERDTLTIVKTKDGKNLLRFGDEYYRMYKYVEDCMVFDKLTTPEMFGSAGDAFGKFVRMLDGYPIEELDETIPNFHNSKIRYRDFLRSVRRDPCGRVVGVMSEIEAIKSRFFDLTRIIDLMEVGEIPVRVTHNDTKVSNVLFDKDSGKALCVIDLDTVMPGSILYDFGDAIRSGASTSPEDGAAPQFDLNYFMAFATNFLAQTGDILKPKEIENLAFACRTITLELAMRFLDDYINGDTYFRCKYENHNLVRAQNQLALLKSMEEHYDEMCAIINNILSRRNELVDPV